MSDIFDSYIQARIEIAGSKKSKVGSNRKPYQKGRDFAAEVSRERVSLQSRNTVDNFRRGIMSSLAPPPGALSKKQKAPLSFL